MRKFMFLMFFFVFVVAGYANADTVIVWSGDVSFVIKTTSPYQDSSGNIKFKTQSQRSTGKIQMLAGENGPIANAAGNYIELLDNTGNVVIGVKEIAMIATDVTKSRSNQFSIVGTGEFTEPGSSPAVKGIAYADFRGTVKEDSTGDNPISIIVSGKIGGGVNTDQDNFVFSANLNSKMFPQ